MADGDPDIWHVVQATDQFLVPAVVLGEYRFGLVYSRHRSRYEVWLEQLAGIAPVLVVDGTTALHYAEIRFELRKSGKPIPDNDIWIAALSRQHSLAVLSRDRHFDSVACLTRLNW